MPDVVEPFVGGLPLESEYWRQVLLFLWSPSIDSISSDPGLAVCVIHAVVSKFSIATTPTTAPSIKSYNKST